MMNETSKIIIFTFSGITMLLGFLVIIFSCVLCPREEYNVTNEKVVNNPDDNNNLPNLDNLSQLNNQKNDNVNRIIENLRESMTPELDEIDEENNIMVSFTPHYLIQYQDRQICNNNQYQESETEF